MDRSRSYVENNRRIHDCENAVSSLTKLISTSLPQVDIREPVSRWADFDGQLLDLMLNVNMIHISPWAATEGLLRCGLFPLPISTWIFCLVFYKYASSLTWLIWFCYFMHFFLQAALEIYSLPCFPLLQILLRTIIFLAELALDIFAFL